LKPQSHEKLSALFFSEKNRVDENNIDKNKRGEKKVRIV